MRPLTLIHQETAPGATARPGPAVHAVSVELSIQAGGAGPSAVLRAEFVIEGPTHTNPALPLGSPQWGLWEWDVVEVFVASTTASASGPTLTPYYEYQVSPLGQHFELEILKPRVATNRAHRTNGLRPTATKTPTGWRACL